MLFLQPKKFNLYFGYGALKLKIVIEQPGHKYQQLTSNCYLHSSQLLTLWDTWVQFPAIKDSMEGRGLWVTPNSTRGLFSVLLSEIAPGRQAQGYI